MKILNADLSWKGATYDEKMDYLREWYAFEHQYEIESYYEQSNGLGDWWANQEGSVDYFAELLDTQKNLSEYPKDFLKWWNRKRKCVNMVPN